MFIHLSTASIGEAVIASSPVSSGPLRKAKTIGHWAHCSNSRRRSEFRSEPLGKQARSETRSAPDEAARPATQQPRPIPDAGPLAQPKSLEQVGLPAELTLAGDPVSTTRRCPTKSPSARNCFSMAAYRRMGPWRAVPVTIPPALSATAGPLRSASMVGSASGTRRPS